MIYTKLKGCILFATLLLASINTQAQNKDAAIAGHVIDANTNEHLPYITIIVEGTNTATITDDTGHFILSGIPEGTVKLTAKYVGYKQQTLTVHTKNSKTVSANFNLEASGLDADQVVVTASRYATKKREAAAVVNVISPKMFEETLAVNPAGVLDFQPGARVEYNCGNCGFPQLRINGLPGQYSQILLDSRPIFSSLGSVYGLEQLPSSMVERIEIVRGGGSALFGANAIGGVVNIITKEPTRNSLNLSNQTALIGGSAFDINTSLNGSLISDDRKTGAFLYSMVRDRDSYDHNGDDLSELPAIKNQTIGVRAFQKIGDRSKLTFEYHHIHEYRRGGDSLDLAPDRANLAEELDHSINGGGINYEYHSKNNVSSINVYSAAQSIKRKSYFGTEQDPNAFGKTSDITVNAGAQYIHRFEKLWFMPSTFTAGVDYNYNKLNDEMLGYNRLTNQVTNLVGTYAQNEWSKKNLSILLGARLDFHSELENPVASPRVNVRYAPTENITLRASYARGFRAPVTYDEDLHVSSAGGEATLIIVSPDLKPEFSNTANLSFDFWKMFGDWQLNFLVDGFYTSLTNVFALKDAGYDDNGNKLLERINAHNARIAGTNVELRVAKNTKFNFQAGYTFQKSLYTEAFQWSEDVKAEKTMFRAPDHYGYIIADYSPIKPLTVSANATITGPMLIQHYAGVIDTDRNETTPTFLDLSLRVSYDFNITRSTKMQVSLAAKNIFDQFQSDLDYGINKDSKYFYGPALPRSYFVGIKFYI